MKIFKLCNDKNKNKNGEGGFRVAGLQTILSALSLYINMDIL